MNEQEKELLLNLIENDEKLPERFKDLLFPTIHQEYELDYADKIRKEDLLADEDGSFPVPIQTERNYNSGQDNQTDWKNMIVFGDNLQLLKSIYENKDSVIKDKIKGKVKLIYIDPPFATEEDFQNTLGAKAYNDKKKGAEFLEFIRKRLIIAREILADDGAIIVHMDWKKAHYVKVIMDEIFGESNFLNEIIWHYRRWNIASNMFARNHDNLLYYAKNKGQHTFNNLYIPKSEKSSGGGRAWLSVIDEETGKRKSVLQDEKSKGVPMPDVFEVSMINPMALERRKVNYPTQKPEALLARLIEATTNEGDIVMDFFAGSGTTMSVAEKLNRRWVVCDVGKLSYFTTQRRLLQINETKDLINDKKKYSGEIKPFMTAKLGMYDLEKTLTLDREKYLDFVFSLFETENKEHEINGVKFEGEKRGFPVKVFDYLKFKDSMVDATYLKDLNMSLMGREVGRVYIIAPATRVGFIADYEEIDGIRYYFLRVPYEMIQELHKRPFQKVRQPRSKDEVNGIEEMIGFQFVYPPEISSKVIRTDEELVLEITSFKSYGVYDEDGKTFENYETFSSLYIDYDFDGENFIMDEVLFAKDLVKKDTEVLQISLDWKKVGNYIMVVYSDIFGNDFTEKIEIKEDIS